MTIRGFNLVCIYIVDKVKDLLRLLFVRSNTTMLTLVKLFTQ